MKKKTESRNREAKPLAPAPAAGAGLVHKIGIAAMLVLVCLSVYTSAAEGTKAASAGRLTVVHQANGVNIG